jgi:GNAT superfamily N-acetyltransferase
VAAPRYLLRDAQLSDLDFMYEVKREGMRSYVEATWGPWDDAAQRARFQNLFLPSADRVVVVDGRDVGTLSVEWSCDPVALAGIYLLAEVRGRGLGTAILEDVLVRARAMGRGVALRVLKANPRARALYDRLGFLGSGETETHVAMTWTDPLA